MARTTNQRLMTLNKKIASFLPKDSRVVDIVPIEAGSSGFAGGYRSYPRVKVTYVDINTGIKRSTTIKTGNCNVFVS